MKLTNRLSMVADAVGQCEKFVDIGTDHAYLPAYLLLNGKVQCALACDLREQPLQNAEKTVKAYGLEEKIKLRLSDGLQNVAPEEADVIAIAGMGGILISEMIETTPWLRDAKKRLVLQPMTHEEDVRKALYANGFEILSEHTSAEGKRLYLCITAQYNGRVETPEPYVYYSGLLPQGQSKTDQLYLEKIKTRLLKRAEALKEIEPQTAKELFNLLEGMEHASQGNI